MWKIISVTSPGSPKKTKWQAGLMIYVKRFLILPMGKVWYLDFLGIDCRTIMSKIHIYIYLVGNSTNKNINYPHPSWIIFEQLPVASTFKKAKFNLLGKHIIHWKFLHTKKQPWNICASPNLDLSKKIFKWKQKNQRSFPTKTPLSSSLDHGEISPSTSWNLQTSGSLT